MVRRCDSMLDRGCRCECYLELVSSELSRSRGVEEIFGKNLILENITKVSGLVL